jgi:hypothetical protein
VLADHFSCSREDCDRTAGKGDLIIRISAKGQPFEGLCDEHLAEDWRHNVDKRWLPQRGKRAGEDWEC